MTLHMLYLPVRPRGLIACGRGHGLVTNTQSVDAGYLAHSLLARLLPGHDAAPFGIRCFDFQNDHGADDRPLSILAYARQDLQPVRAHAEAHADAAAKAAIVWADAASKPVPAFEAGRRLGFQVRLCPMVRVGRQHPRFRPGAEVDPYVALVQRRLALAEAAYPAAASDRLRQELEPTLPTRAEVYRDWLAGALGPSATLATARILSVRDARLWRKGMSGSRDALALGHRARARLGERTRIDRREVVFAGELQVRDPATFQALLARGVGRHRAFGFGMLLLRAPAGGQSDD